MSTTTPEPLPLPQVVDREAIKAWLQITDDGDDTELDQIALAVDEFVRGLRVADETARGAVEWPAPIILGAQMLAGRLLRRRNSPDGVAAFAGEGAVYVQRNDPDIAVLLRLGAQATPGVG